MYDEGWSVKNKISHEQLPLAGRRTNCISVYISGIEIVFIPISVLDGARQSSICFTLKIDLKQQATCSCFLVACTTAGGGSGCLIQQKQAQWAKVNQRVNVVRHQSKRPIATIYMMESIFNSQSVNFLFTSSRVHLAVFYSTDRHRQNQIAGLIAYIMRQIKSKTFKRTIINTTAIPIRKDFF